MDRPEPSKVAAEVLTARHPGADSLLLAGSMLRGEQTATSDLDLVALYAHLDSSYRESFYHQGYPVEVFAHDEHTLEFYFIEKDRASGIGSMLHMVDEGVPIPGPTALNRRIKARAKQLLMAGPPPWSPSEVDYSRYTIAGLLDDLTEPRNVAEYRAVVATLHHLVGNHFLRTRGLWGATAKTIPRRFAQADAALAQRFDDAFGAAFFDDPRPLFAVTDAILEPSGGRLFEGYSMRSDSAWRREPPAL